ncbi:MAG: hypothetical protein Q8867_01220 [Bacteroidota bacterium]|nr:hypothetical protein [Bacteroidota bacterium]
MAEKEIWVIGIHITDRIKDAGKIQEIFTKYGCCIKTRLGLHKANGNICSPAGLILLELTGEPAEFPKLMDELQKVGGIEVKHMEFSD